jgi:hypothetical protein
VIYKHACARSAARALCPSGSAHPTGPAGLKIKNPTAPVRRLEEDWG